MGISHLVSQTGQASSVTKSIAVRKNFSRDTLSVAIGLLLKILSLSFKSKHSVAIFSLVIFCNSSEHSFKSANADVLLTFGRAATFVLVSNPSLKAVVAVKSTSCVKPRVTRRKLIASKILFFSRSEISRACAKLSLA